MEAAMEAMVVATEVQVLIRMEDMRHHLNHITPLGHLLVPSEVLGLVSPGLTKAVTMAGIMGLLEVPEAIDVMVATAGTGTRVTTATAADGRISCTLQGSDCDEQAGIVRIQC
jgi:hypothetical protein